MRVCVCSLSTWKKAGVWGLCAAAVLLLLRYPQAAATGISRGLSLCGQLLIPSLFPFLTVAGTMIKSGMIADIGYRLRKVTTAVFGVSGSAAGALLLSVLGGYPAGANAVMELLETGELSEEEARVLLRYAVNAGPAFVIGGVGVGMLGSVKAGVLLLIAHLAASLLIALFHRRRHPPAASHRVHTQPMGSAVIAAVHDATYTLLGMCGFVLVSSCLLSLADAMGTNAVTVPWLRTVCVGMLEVTTGCFEAVRMGVWAPLFLGCILGFSGLSVCGQIAARTADRKLVNRAFFLTRLCHGLLGGCFSVLLFWWFPPDAVSVPASVQFSSAVATPAVGLVGTVVMMAMCVLFLATLPKDA